MPLLRIQTNQAVAPEQRDALLTALTRTVAELLAKPPAYVQVVLETEVAMAFGGTTEPTALAELRSLGLPHEAPKAISARLCTLFQEELRVPPDRTFIVCADHPRTHWGWNGGTFG